MEPDNAMSVASDNLDNLRRQQLLGDLYFQTNVQRQKGFLSLHIGLKVKITKKLLPLEIVQIVAGNSNGQVSFVWSWHLFRRICLTSGNRGTAGVGDSVVLVRSWT